MSSLAKRAAYGAGLLIAMQVLQRLVTFSVNSMVIRRSSVEIIGFASNDMELLLATLVFLSTESFRLAALRVPIDYAIASGGKRLTAGQQVELQRGWSQLIRLAWAPVFLGWTFAGSIVFGFVDWKLLFESGLGAAGAERQLCSLLYCAAAAVEVTGEPGLILTSHGMDLGVRARAVLAGVLAKALALFLLVAVLDWGVLAFGVAQLAYATATVLVYIWHAVAAARAAASGAAGEDPAPTAAAAAAVARVETGREQPTAWDVLRQMVPRPSLGLLADPWLLALGLSSPAPPEPKAEAAAEGAAEPDGAEQMVGVFARQSILKHLLTEGDRIVLTANANDVDKGVFNVAHNYGSLAARLAFRPIEEAGRSLFARVGAEVVSKSQSSPASEAKAAARQAAESLALVLWAVLFLGLTIAALGPWFTHTVIDLVLGARWSETEAPQVLGVYCLYVLSLASNGVTEAFVQAVGDSSVVNRQTSAMLAFFVVYAAAAWSLLRWFGPVGLVVAGILNMALRTTFNLHFAMSFLAQHGAPLSLLGVLPAWPVLTALAAGATASAWSQAAVPALIGGTRGQLAHLGVGAACGVVVLAVAWLSERTRVRTALRSMRRKQE